MSIILNEVNYFWKLGFSESVSNVYTKVYFDKLSINIDLERKVISFCGNNGVGGRSQLPFSQVNYIILEVVDRLLIKGYPPTSIVLTLNDNVDIRVLTDDGGTYLAIKCYEWENSYDVEVHRMCRDTNTIHSSFSCISDLEYFCAYTSRLKAGAVESRYTVFSLPLNGESSEVYVGGLFEEGIRLFNRDFEMWSEEMVNSTSKTQLVGEFQIESGTLTKYCGASEEVAIPSIVHRLRNAVFWNCTSIRRISIPDTVTDLGGDTFYNCLALESLVIPKNVSIIGDNPFANCPRLSLGNRSPYFILEDGALYDSALTRLIYVSIKRTSDTFIVPDGVVSVGKHSFYGCRNLTKIVVSESVRILENNPFSNIPELRLENNSPHFTFVDGALYNKQMTILFYYEHLSTSPVLNIPEGIRIIGRHSFFNCKTIELVTIPTTVEIIGYNPFTNCSALSLRNLSPHFRLENGSLMTADEKTLIYRSIPNKEECYLVPDGVRRIGRSAFFGCHNLRAIVLHEGLEVIDRSAFAYCTNLEEIHIPASVLSVGEWAFSGCNSLKEITIDRRTTVEPQAFFNSNVRIVWR